MSDNVGITPGSGVLIASDDVGGVQYQRVKLDAGADGASAPVSAAAPLPVTLPAAQVAALTPYATVAVSNLPGTQPVSGAVNVSNFPATQPVSASALPLPAGASTEATLASMSAKLPATLGAKASAASAAVVLATDDAQIGTKVTAVAALGAGGAGLIGWLSSIWNAISTQLPASLGIKTAAASLSVAPASDGVFNVSYSPASLTDRSGTLAAGATAQNAAPANVARKGFWIQNNSSGALWINTLATAVQSQPSLQIAAGAYYEAPPGGAGTGAISIIGATTGQAFSAREW